MIYQEHVAYCNDLAAFNEKLADWSVKYNSASRHKGLELKTPMQYIIENKSQFNMCMGSYTKMHLLLESVTIKARGQFFL